MTSGQAGVEAGEEAGATEDVLSALAERAGVARAYMDTTRTRREAGPETLAACLTALGFDLRGPGAVRDALAAAAPGRLPRWVVADPVSPPPLALAPDTEWVLTLEDGAAAEGRGAVPPLPTGRHRLDLGGETAWILSAPPALPLPARGWGVTLPLYGLRTAEEGGVGDYADLAAAAAGLGRSGADFVGLNPVHAGFPGQGGVPSPYTPSHRRRLSVLHLHAPGEAATPAGDLIDYGPASRARMAALEAEFAAAGRDPGFAAFRAREGAALELFATYQALAERLGPTWDGWAAEWRDCDAPEVTRFAGDQAGRIAFHAWLQYRADAQLGAAAAAAKAAGMAHGLYLDLAVGTHPHGAETWADPASFAFGVALGAPPDAFSAEGQNWSLAPLNPRTLEATGFAPLALTLRAQLRHAGMLRIDHILGFERAFWVPEGGLPGTYVRMPKAAMLAVARIEAARAGGAVIVGEDLGNIPQGLAGDLAASRILGCDVAAFVPGRAPEDYREAALASFGTHDLPTFAGWRAARDIAVRTGLGLMDADAAAAARAARADEVAALGAADADALHARLGRCRSRLVALQIEDILGLSEQPNLPGTVESYPNWRRRLPVRAADLGADERVRRAAEIMAASGRGRGRDG